MSYTARILHGAALAVLGAGTLVLVGRTSPPPRQPSAAPRPIPATARVSPRPCGLFVCKGPEATPDREVNLPFVDGWLVRPGWEAIEPAEGRYDWTYLDHEIQTARRLKKRVALAVLGGPQAPAWLYGTGAQAFRYTSGSRYRPTVTARMPVIWDDAYLRRWTALVGALGRRYAGEPTLALVHVTGATENGLEMQLPDSSVDRAEWKRRGYSANRVVVAWKRLLDAYAAAFPRVPLDVDVHPVLGSDRVAEEVLAYGRRTLGDRFGVYGGWLSGKGPEQDPHHAGLHRLVRGHAPSGFAAFQLIGNETHQPERFASGGLRQAVEQGLGWGATYFEVWRADVLNPRLRPTLMDLAARVRRQGGPGQPSQSDREE
jgi:hypothetical protein